MYFDEEFLKSLPEDTSSAIAAICKVFTNMRGKIHAGEDKYTLIQEAYAFVAAYYEANGMNIEIPQFKGTIGADEDIAVEFFIKLEKQASQRIGQSEFEQYKNLFATRLGKVFHYEFSEGDLSLIQSLINELRELISTTEELEEDHRHRLIKKLEKLQSELHKKVSDLDRFWGFCLDLSIVIGLMGKNAEPAADLVKKIVAIIWPAQTRAYGLPSGLPLKLLGQPEEEDKSEDKKS
jgi:hypothetical protein